MDAATLREAANGAWMPRCCPGPTHAPGAGKGWPAPERPGAAGGCLCLNAAGAERTRYWLPGGPMGRGGLPHAMGVDEPTGERPRMRGQNAPPQGQRRRHGCRRI